MFIQPWAKRIVRSLLLRVKQWADEALVHLSTEEIDSPEPSLPESKANSQNPPAHWLARVQAVSQSPFQWMNVTAPIGTPTSEIPTVIDAFPDIANETKQDISFHSQFRSHPHPSTDSQQHVRSPHQPIPPIVKTDHPVQTSSHSSPEMLHKSDRPPVSFPSTEEPALGPLTRKQPTSSPPLRLKPLPQSSINTPSSSANLATVGNPAVAPDSTQESKQPSSHHLEPLPLPRPALEQHKQHSTPKEPPFVANEHQVTAKPSQPPTHEAIAPPSPWPTHQVSSPNEGAPLRPRSRTVSTTQHQPEPIAIAPLGDDPVSPLMPSPHRWMHENSPSEFEQTRHSPQDSPRWFQPVVFAVEDERPTSNAMWSNLPDESPAFSQEPWLAEIRQQQHLQKLEHEQQGEQKIN
ncbi:hypothetical protein ACQ4M4_12100 [Leptolyngbya sp. AN02str]|uniref:hypothetical protein n=1 Tax=Leptolyngbya sp. AN02str TaxID=3423363 RepID=UPI003D31AF78